MAVEVSGEGHLPRLDPIFRKRKTLSPKVLLDLCQLWDEFQHNDSGRVVARYSALPGIFCTGLDLSGSASFLTGEKAVTSADEAYLFGEKNEFRGLSLALLKVKRLERPAIAAINGGCTTGVNKQWAAK